TRDNVVRRLRSSLGLLFKKGHHQSTDLSRYRRWQSSGFFRHLLHQKGHDLVSLKRTSSEEHLIHHQAEGIEIRAMIHLVSGSLLRSHVGRSAVDRAVLRELRLTSI